MRVFQLKLTAWIAAGFFALMLVVLIAFNFYAIHRILRDADDRMETLSEGIMAELTAHGTPPGGPVSPAAIASIDSHLAFATRHRRVGYAIVSLSHEVLYQTPGFSLPREAAFLARERRRPFIVRVESEGDDLEDALSEWHVMFRCPGKDVIVFISDRSEYELVEKILEGMGIALGLAVLLALPLGHLMSRKVLASLDAIDEAVQRLRQGDLSARIATAHSQDEVARLIEALNRTFDSLQASFERIQRFSADAAHELNTPLTALRGSIEVCLGRERTTAEYQAVLTECLEQITTLSRLLKDLLLLARPGTAEQRRLMAPVNASDLVDQVVRQARAANAGSAVRVDCDIQPDIVLNASEGLLRRLCHNLVDNALRFSGKAGAVSISLRRQADAAVLEVRDQGIGIAAADLDRIFEPFYQVEESRSVGTGLGLAIVAWIVELHGGAITVESTPGQGTRFRVTLPNPPQVELTPGAPGQ